MNSNINNQCRALASKRPLRHRSSMTFYKSQPWKDAEREENDKSALLERAAHIMRHHLGHGEGGGVWRAHNKLTHCFSEHGRKQMLDCQAKYTQTPYQAFGCNGSSRQTEPVGLQRPFGCAAAHNKTAWSRGVAGGVQAFFGGRAEACAQCDHSDSWRRERWRENDQVFMGGMAGKCQLYNNNSLRRLKRDAHWSRLIRTKPFGDFGLSFSYVSYPLMEIPWWWSHVWISLIPHMNETIPFIFLQCVWQQTVYGQNFHPH